MFGRLGKFRMFHGEMVSDALAKHTSKIQAAIRQESEDYILNVNEIEYINYLVQRFAFDCPHIDFDSKWASRYETQISPDDYPIQFPFHDILRPDETVSTWVVVYHLPFTGNADLFRCMTSRWKSVYLEVFLEESKEEKAVCFEIMDFHNSGTNIQAQEPYMINNIKFFSDALINDAESYCTQLPMHIEQLFKARKKHLLDTHNQLASLGVPLRKREGGPGTYAVPTPRMRKSLLVKPSVAEKGYKPEPTLDQATYQEILLIIHEVGKTFEMLPSAYIHKGEEDLRDHILLYLAPRFKDEGSVTGETFNKVGKTDILYRYKNTNVFIAECKFWGGQAQYLETISQLLSYLTWRDSKAAVIIFVKNKEISSVLETVRTVTSLHSNHLGFVNEQDASWFNYRFHINDDPNREVKLAVMLYHIPEVYGGRVKQN